MQMRREEWGSWKDDADVMRVLYVVPVVFVFLCWFEFVRAFILGRERSGKGERVARSCRKAAYAK